MTGALALVAAALLVGRRPARPTRRTTATAAGLPVRRARRHRRVSDDDLAATIELLVLAIGQGLLPAAAVREIALCTEGSVRAAMDATIALLDAGDRFADAIGTMPELLGPRAHALADSLAAADRDGLPLAPVLERLALEARQIRRRQIDERTRRLPVRLAVPLVLCTLPSFALLTVVPMLLAALSSLHR